MPLAILALVAGQFVMVLIMTMTPLHMTDHGHDLDNVGFVISGHTFGMFALSPISGRLTDRFGAVRVIYAGMAIIAISGAAVGHRPAGGDGTPARRAVPARLGLEPGLRGGLRDALRRPVARRADPAAGCGRRPDLELAAAASLGSGRRGRDGRLRHLG